MTSLRDTRNELMSAALRACNRADLAHSEKEEEEERIGNGLHYIGKKRLSTFCVWRANGEMKAVGKLWYTVHPSFIFQSR